ncbi:NADP-dependent oxidoreductase [Pontibacter actiniarum]|uniref:Zinc-binding oxidoreductase n=1 Tax=Pontibacter actiniarum TaxID=323450 RepID=A0A1X9YRC5_9BACT|nr:NADP-dependent oxidoreductase [Pontibacter actiniarum]ARS35425.1 zinc-binding oxidoreductase [Pontibacter actiniarum]
MEEKMKAAVYDEFGGPEKIQIREVAVPEVKEGEVLVRIKAAGVNPVDYVVREGYLKDALPYQFPVIPGWDVAGVVEERGFSARRFNVGDEVYAYARRPVVQHGTFAEYIVIPESYLAARPQRISWEEAAGIPLVGLTAYQSLYDAGQLLEGQTVLILGASGGVGSLGIQLAKVKGARVIGVASEKNHAFMKELGADETIDYRNNNVGEAVKAVAPDGVDLIFDCASGETLQQSLLALKPSGKLVSILNQGEGLDAGIDFQYVFVEPNARQLQHLQELADAGQLKVFVSGTYALDETAEAMKQIQTTHTTGKIVIVP